MKKILLVICMIVTILCSFLAFSACRKDNGNEDEYGYERPENCWISEAFIPMNRSCFPSKRNLFNGNSKTYYYFGDGGKSGLLQDDTVDSIEERAEIGIPGECGLSVYCVFYGTCSSEELKNIHTNFSISLVTDEGIYYADDDEAFYSNENIIGEVRVLEGNLICTESKIPLYASANQRIKLEYDASKSPQKLPQKEMTAVFGVLEISPLGIRAKEGTLYVTLSVDIDAERETRVIYSTASVKIGKDPSEEVKPLANVGDVSVGYLTSSDYNGGSYSENAIRRDAIFENGGYCYMVLDFSITTLVDNDGTHSIRTLAHVSDRGRLDAVIEEAPTIKLETSTLNNKTNIYAIYGIPPNAGEKKTVRMLVRMFPISDGSVSVGAFIFGKDGVEIGGEVFRHDMLNLGVPALCFTLSEDGTYYIVSSIADPNLEKIIVPDALGDGIPVTTLGERWASNYNKLSDLDLGNGIIKIPTNAFYGFKRDWYERFNIIIGRGVAIIEPQAFDRNDGVNNSCYGNVTVRGDRYSLMDEAFDKTNISELILGVGLVYIGENAFGDSNYAIVYEGTMEQWNSIEKHPEWANQAHKIICSDGTITL